MAQVMVDPVIDLGVIGDPDGRGAAVAPTYPRRRLFVALVVLVCLSTVVSADRGRPELGEPLWTGTVSLAGFTLGDQNLYLATPDGATMGAVDLRTGRPRWNVGVTDLPYLTMDVGHGVVAVTSRPPSNDGYGAPDLNITFVRDATGEQLAHTTGQFYPPSAPDLPLIVFTDRSRRLGGCAGPEASCADMTAWDRGTATVLWSRAVHPGSISAPYSDLMEEFLQTDEDGAVQIRNLASGDGVATFRLPAEDRDRGAQVVVTRDALVTVVHGSDQIALTAYQRPSFRRLWWLAAAEPPTAAEGLGSAYVSGCFADACLLTAGTTTRVIDVSAGTVSLVVPSDNLVRAGAGVFVVLPPSPTVLSPGQTSPASVLDPSGHRIAGFSMTSLVPWDNSGDRILVTSEGRDRTGFIVIDSAGDRRTIGSVPGVGLNCKARGSILACANRIGVLQVWQLPL